MVPRQSFIATVIIVIGAVIVSGCGAAVSPSSAAPAATEEPTPTVEPSPTPETDIGEAFLAQLNETDALLATISGTITLGELEGEVAGQLVVSGADREQLISIEIPGAPTQTDERIHVDGVTYTRQANGTWLASEGDGGNGLASFMSDVTELTVAGEEDWEGRSVVRLESAEPVQIGPGALGITDPTVADVDGAVAFFAQEDGTPAGLELAVSWTQEAGGASIDCSFEMRFTFEDAAAVAIDAPEDAWTVHESAELGYRMAYPLDWDVTHEPASGDVVAFDLFVGPVDEEVQVYAYTDLPAGLVPNEWFRDSALALVETYGAEPEALGDLTLPDGSEVRLFGLHFTDGAVKTYAISASVFAGTRAWDVDWLSNPGTEAEDLARLTQFIETFSPTGE